MHTSPPSPAARYLVLLLLLLTPLLTACELGRGGARTTGAPVATAPSEPAARADTTGNRAASLAETSYVATGASVAQQDGAPLAGRGVSVSAEGSVEAPPDVAYANFGFVAESRALAPAQARVATDSSAVVRRLTSLGVKREDIQTTAYTVGRDNKRGVFVVRSGVRVKVRDVAATGKLLDAAVAAGAKRVGGVTFGIDDRAALERQARQRAMEAANAKAAELARHGNVRLGPPITITEGPPPYYDYGYETGTGLASPDSGGAPTTSIEAGQLRIVIAVQVTYSIQ